MPSLSSIRAANAAFSPSYSPVAIFVGGTSGIGQGIAEVFARHTKGNAHIVIIGRNRAAADTIISQFPKPSQNDKTGANFTHEFVQCDVSLIKNVQSTAKELLGRYPKINFLVMTPGVMTTDGRNETVEGIDKKLAVHYYSRWKFIDLLMPALRSAKEQGEDAKVMSVMSAGFGGEIDLNDLGLKKTYSLKNAGLQAATYNDLMMEEYAKRNPGMSFMHAYPGFVRTRLLSSSNSMLLRALSPVILTLAYPLSISHSESGEYLLHALLGNNKPGAFRIGSRGEDIGMRNYVGSEEARRKLWEHTVQETNVSS